MNKLKKGKKTAFSIADIILFILIITAICSAVFSEQIQTFLGERNEAVAEYSFIVEKVSEDAVNRPQIGEEMRSEKNRTSLGIITDIVEKSDVYQSEVNGELHLSTLNCTAISDVTRTDAGAMAGDVLIKAGAQIRVQTESATFKITVISVKINTK